MFLLTPRAHGYLAQIALRNGTIAGEGRADTKKNAMYFACLDAIYHGYSQAAMGHATMLSIEDENAVRAAAASSSARANPLHLRLPHLRVPGLSRLSQTTRNRIGAGAVVAAGAAVLYWLYKAPALTTAVVTPGQETIQAPGGGVILALPPGAVWDPSSPKPWGGTSNPLVIPTGTIAAGQSETVTLNWTAGGVAQTAAVTLVAA